MTVNFRRGGLQRGKGWQSMYGKKQRNIASFICVVFLFVTFASLLFIAKEADHVCTGADCAICAAVAEAKDSLARLKNGFASLAGALAVSAVLLLLFALAGALAVAPQATPVAQRVRMNN